MIYPLKGRLYPTLEQSERMMINFNCSRFVFNKCLDLKNKIYKKKGLTIRKYTMIKYLPYLKKQYSFLNQADSICLQSSIENLYTAFDNFFNKRADKPKFKKKKTYAGSFTTKFVTNNIEIVNNKIKLPKIGFVKVKLPKKKLKELNSNKIKRVTVSLKPSDKFIISVSFEVNNVIPLPKNDNVIGIDLGIKSYITDSNGFVIDCNRFLEPNLKKLRRFQRKLSREEKFSSNWFKTKKKIALLHEKITNQRKDFQQKTSSHLINENQVIIVEDLSVKKMLSNKMLSKMISDCSWFSFLEMLRYKAEWYGRTFIKVSPYYPSSQLCNKCGYQNKEVRNLKVRHWTCPECGEHHDRDYNASLNILKEGLRTLSAS